MGNSLQNLVAELTDDTPYCLIWLDKDDINFESDYENINDILEILFLACKTDVILEHVCRELEENGKEKEATYLRDSIITLKTIIPGETLDEMPLVQPIHMSKVK